jgi:hypothetical protein
VLIEIGLLLIAMTAEVLTRRFPGPGVLTDLLRVICELL